MQTNVTPLPVRGNDAVEILVNDHQTIKTLLTQLTQNEGGAGAKTTLEQLKAALTIHNATEENLVYPALNKVAGKKAESQKLYHETAEADVLLFELDTMLKEGDEADFPAKAKKFQAAVLEHIEDEEDKAFPHLQKYAEPEQAQMLTQSVREFRSALHYNAGGVGTRAETGTIDGQTPSRT
jgi:hemerythrin superfamily protein